jgi:membrane-bound lytic murein transglycosylase D
VGLSEADLRSLNNIPPRMLIKAGSALMVPRDPNIKTDVPGHVADNGQISFAPEIVTVRTTVHARKRDTLISVANRYGVSASNLADWNNLGSSASLRTGQSLVAYLPMRAARAARAEAIESSREAHHSSKASHKAGGKASASSKRASAPAPRGGKNEPKPRGGTPAKKRK